MTEGRRPTIPTSSIGQGKNGALRLEEAMCQLRLEGSSWLGAESTSMSRDEVMAAALDLNREDRAALARRLLASLNDDELTCEEIEALWVDEAERRLDAVLSGRVTPIPAAEAWERVHKALG